MNGVISLGQYKERLQKGLVAWKKVDGKNILVIKQFDEAHNELPALEKVFSATEMARNRNDKALRRAELEKKALEFERQAIDLRQQMEVEDLELDPIFQDVETDVSELEKVQATNIKDWMPSWLRDKQRQPEEMAEGNKAE